MTNMPSSDASLVSMDPAAAEFYTHTLRILTDAKVPFMVGGAYAFSRYTGIARHTKDLDLFVREQDAETALRHLADAGYRTEMTFTHWLGKAFHGEYLVDVIFSAGNGVAVVDDGWLEHAVDDEILGVPVRLIPAEEMIWSKAFIMERERFDGADVAHVIRAIGRNLDWARLVDRFDKHWRVLLAHLVLFPFIYPSERSQVPMSVVRELMARLETDQGGVVTVGEKICQGTLISREQYLPDVTGWGYEDARLEPRGNMSADQIAVWTAAIAEDHPPTTSIDPEAEPPTTPIR